MSWVRFTPPRLLAAVARRYYTRDIDVDFELKRLEVARILTGIFALVRIVEIVQAQHVLSGSYERLGVAVIALAVCATIGFLTPVSTLALALLTRHLDNVYSTNTLGTTVLIHVLLLLVLLRAGRTYSLDYLLLRRFADPVLNRIYEAVYGKPSETEIKSAYTFVFLLYAVISFAALWFHLKDPYWIGGTTVKSMITSTYLCKHPDLFREVDRNFPWLLGAVSIAAGIAQSIFQFLMIPLMFFRPGRFFVRWHGMFFFVVSLLLLNLSFLPHYELVLWWLLMWPTQATSDPIGKAPVQLPAWQNVLYCVYSLLGIIFLTTIHWGSLKNAGRTMFSASDALTRVITRAAGMEVPIVFDTVDLEMGNRWALLYRKTPSDPSWALTPLTTLDGRKSNYLGRDVLWAGNHNSDLLYFGTTLPFRRRMIGLSNASLSAFIDSGAGQPAIERMIRFDYQIKELSGPVRYQCVVMNTEASKVSLLESNEQRLTPRPILWRWYVFDGATLRRSQI